MKKHTYNPPEESPISGDVILNLPTYRKRLELIQQHGIHDDVSVTKNITVILDVVESHVESVDLRCGDEAIKDLDELGMYREGVEIINEIGGLLIGGIPLGEASKPH